MSSKVSVGEILIAIREMTAQDFVVSVSDQYAPQWDELALFITVDERARNKQVIALANIVLTYLNQVLPRGNPYFCWQVQFRRRDQIVDVLFPGDSIRKASALRNRG